MSTRFPKALTAAALAVAVSGAGAAGAATSSTAAKPKGGSAAPKASGGAKARTGKDGQRAGETALTGEARARVTAVAKSKIAGGTILRVETDADGRAAFEAHMLDAEGGLVTVYVDKSFRFVGLQDSR